MRSYIKWKMISLLISATALLATMTACGTGNDESTPVEQPMTVYVITDEEFSGDTNKDISSSEAATDDVSDGVTVEEWIASEEAATYIQALNTSLDSTGAAIGFEADGAVLCMVFHYSEDVIGTDGSNLTEEQKEAEQERLQQKYDSIKMQLEPMRDVLRDAMGDSELVVRIVYKTSNGTELFRQDL